MAATHDDELLTIDELAAVTGLSVRTTRYYASLGLIPPPVRRGRIALYGRDHRARLDMVRALQDHGFTLQAVERFLASLPDDITAEDLAMQRAMITSWTSEPDVWDRIAAGLRDIGLPRDTLAATGEAIQRHMTALAEELSVIFEEQRREPWRRRQHTPEEAARLEETLPRLRELTLDAIVASFQQAVNGVISRSLRGEDRAGR